MTRRRRSRPIWRASSNEWRPSSHGCGAEPPRASGKPLTLGAGLLGPRDSILDHDRRPQADRHPVRRDRVRVLAAGPSAPGRLLDDRRDQLHRDDRQHAPAGHAAHADAGVRLDDAGRAVPHRARVPADHGRADLPHVRPVLRQPLLRRRGRRRPPPLAAPLLDLRAPRGLHPDPAGLRDRLRGAADLRAQAAVRRAGRRLFGRPDRLLRLRRVEPPHVRRGHGAGRGRRVLDRDHAHRDPDGREDLQLARDALGRIDPRDDCVPLRGRPRRALHDRRALGHHARLAARGPPADRQLLRRRAPALRAHRRQPLRPLRRRLLLVAEDHRTAPRRAARQAPVLGPLRGLQHDLLPPALPGRDRDASPHLHLRGADRLDPLAHGLHRRRLRDRRRRPPLHGQRVAEPACGRPCARRPVGRAHARVADLVAAAAARFRHDPSGPLRDTFWREKYGPRGAPPAPSHDHIHLPAPSHWPVVVGLGMAVLAVGALTHLTIVLMGALVTIVGIFRLALEHHRTPAHEHQTGGLGLDHRKVALWVFLGSECFFFGTLIATYLAYRGRSVVGPEPHEILNTPLPTVSTFALLMSSLLMVLALAAVERDDRRHARLWLFGTAFFGLIFLAFQAWEFTQFVREGLTPQQNLFGSTFFVLTGFHGAHVTVGVVWLLSLWLLDLRGRLRAADAVKVEVAGLYWHFVDVVWIAIFTLVYLIP